MLTIFNIDCFSVYCFFSRPNHRTWDPYQKRRINKISRGSGRGSMCTKDGQILNVYISLPANSNIHFQSPMHCWTLEPAIFRQLANIWHLKRQNEITYKTYEVDAVQKHFSKSANDINLIMWKSKSLGVVERRETNIRTQNHHLSSSRTPMTSSWEALHAKLLDKNCHKQSGLC